MKKITKFRILHPATREEQPVVEPRLLKLNKEVFRAIKYRNTFSVTKARFLPDGDSHCVVISFDEESGTKMKLKIDGEAFYEVDTEMQLQGNAELDIDGLVVDFVWELDQVPKFSFFTRDSSVDTNVVGSSSGGGNDSESASSAKPWQDHEHIYVLQIIGM